MSDRIAAFIVGEGNWLPIAMAVALATVIVGWRRHARFAVRDRVMEAMNLFVGVTLLVMGIGHLLAVTAKLWQGSLNGSPALLYPIGIAIVIPSALIVLYANRANAAALNGWMAVTLVVLGLINIPLAIPPLLNIAYRKHSRAGTGRAIVAAFMLVNLGLFAGGMLFLLSGARTFEEFRGVVSLTTTVAAQELPPAPGRLFDVDRGRRLHLLCGGTGSPTVVIEAGASSFAIDFTLVQRELQKSNRVCAYDRAGSGWSDPLPPFTPSRDAEDLHALLTAAKEPGPYVLVGASRGGLLVRGYLAAYPSDVAALVFIDPATEDRLFGMLGGRAVAIAEMTPEQMRSTLPSQPVRIPRRPVQQGTPFDRLPPELYQQRLLLDERLIASGPETLTPEQIGAYQESERAFLASLLATRQAGTPFGDRPTVVLSRGIDRSPDREQSHAAVAKLSTRSRHRVVAGAGHEIHLFDPPAVIAAVREVIQLYNAK